MDWYDKHGPYDVLIDGANVALFGQNIDGGGFRTEQIRAVVQQVRRRLHLLLRSGLYVQQAHGPVGHLPGILQLATGMRWSLLWP
jgi:hypothetical protein